MGVDAIYGYDIMLTDIKALEACAMKKLIIIGAGGFGRETAWLVEQINSNSPEWDLLGFMDDNPDNWGKRISGYTVLGGTQSALDFPDAYYVCAVGASETRRRVIQRLEMLLPNPKYAVLIDPRVVIANSINIGDGTIICISNVLTVDINVGRHTIINCDCVIGHDCRLGDFVTLYPSVNLSGNSTLGECVEMGTGSITIQGISIGENTIVGAGAVVIRNLPPHCTAVGVPAKVIKQDI